MAAYSVYDKPRRRLKAETLPRNEILVGAREQLGLRQEDVATAVGISRVTLSFYETLRLYPSEGIQRRICDFYTKKGIPLSSEKVFPQYLREFIPYRGKSVEEVSLRDIMGTQFTRLVASPKDDPVSIFEKREFEEAVRKALETLELRERGIIELHFGFNNEPPKTLEEIGKHLGLEGSHVRNLEQQALRKLRQPSRVKYLLSYLG